MLKALLQYHFIIFGAYITGLNYIFFEGDIIKHILFETRKRPKPKKERQVIDKYLKRCMKGVNNE